MIRKLLAPIMTILISGSLAWAAAPDGQEDLCANAAVIFCDNFEARVTGSGDLTRRTYKSGWALSEFNRMTVASGVGFGGGKALQFAYPAGVGGIGYMDTAWSGQRTIYLRWYAKWSSNWKWSPVETKHMFMSTGGGVRSLWPGFVRWADPQLLHVRVNGEGMYQNDNGVMRVELDRWYCLEVRNTLNTAANVADGAVESWIDGVRHWNYPNQILVSTPPFTNTYLTISGNWNCLTSACTDLRDQHPAMNRWHDNIVVSTQRIGCLGAPPPPTTTLPPPPAPVAQPPAAPSNLTLR